MMTRRGIFSKISMVAGLFGYSTSIYSAPTSPTNPERQEILDFIRDMRGYVYDEHYHRLLLQWNDEESRANFRKFITTKCNRDNFTVEVRCDEKNNDDREIDSNRFNADFVVRKGTLIYDVQLCAAPMVKRYDKTEWRGYFSGIEWIITARN